MKKLLTLAAFFFLLCTSASAQIDKQRELGIRIGGLNFGGFNSFDLVFKKQRSAEKYARWRATFLNMNFSSAKELDNFTFGAALAFGMEKRKALNEQFYFVRGPEFQGSLNFSRIEPIRDAQTAYGIGAGFGYILGLQYNVSKLFFVSLETIPGISFGFSKAPDRTSFSGNIGFSSTAAVSVGWRF